MAKAAVVAGADEALEIADMQGLVARAYGHLPFAYYLLCRITNAAAARAWLGQMADQVSTAEEAKNDNPALVVAISFAGLVALGLSEDSLASFPRPMREGMVSEHRSRILGDRGASDPGSWRWGGAATTDTADGPRTVASDIHLLVILYAKTTAELDTVHASRRVEWAGALEEVAEPILGCLMDGSEHFGFADGLSQPIIKGWPSRRGSVNPPAPAAPAKFSDVEPGEILFGYKDNYRRVAEGPTVADDTASRALPPAAWSPRRRDLGRNGSFLVFRQLAQDVAAFNAFVDRASRQTAARGRAMTPAHIGAKMVGRWASGAPIVLYPDADPGEVADNDFGYHNDDQQGLRCCPVGAHVRRSNPRDGGDEPVKTLRSTMTHRILRRGRPYGLKLLENTTEAGHQPEAERGLLFLCLNVDLERQFEFIQHTWLNNNSFGGLYDEVDPLTGPQPAQGGRFSVPDLPVRRRFDGIPEFVTTKGGGYFFLPGVRAIRFLASMKG